MLALNQWLATEALFTLGLGLDIWGASLLASGLIISPSAILDLSRTYVGFNRHVALSRARDKVKAEIGIGLLVVGFATQCLGYLVSLGNETLDVRDHFHVAGGLAAVVVGLILGGVVYAAARRPLLRREMFQLARIREEGGLRTHPDINLLQLLGNEEWPSLPGESPMQYAARVFGWRLPPHEGMPPTVVP